MRAMPALLTMMLASACAGPLSRTPGGATDVEVKADRFTGEVTRSVELNLARDMAGEAVWLVALASSKHADHVILDFRRHSLTWTWLRCRQVDLLVDGRSVLSDEGRHDGRVIRGGGGRVGERLVVAVPSSTVRTLASGARVEGRTCHDEWVLTDAHQAALASLLSPSQPSAP